MLAGEAEEVQSPKLTSLPISYSIQESKSDFFFFFFCFGFFSLSEDSCLPLEWKLTIATNGSCSPLSYACEQGERIMLGSSLLAPPKVVSFPRLL